MAEAAGFVLAAMPICVTVVEKYADVAKLLQRFRHYGEEALYVSQAINIQKSIYRNTIRILLSSIVPQEEAQEMSSDPTHRGWSEASVDQRINERLGDSLDAFVDAASAVKIKLAMLESFGHECRSQVAQAKQDGLKMAKRSKTSIRTRIKFAFSQSEIELLITTVSRLTQEMQTLIQQTEATSRGDSVLQPTTATKRSIEKYNTIKRAAENLYQALSYACTVHTEHQARLSLQAVHNVPSQIVFTLTMNNRRLTSNHTSPIDEPGHWLTVESAVSGTLTLSEPLRVLKEVGKPYKRERDEDDACDSAEVALTGPCKTVRTKDVSTPIVPESTTVSSMPQVEHVNLLPNFCTQENFCAQLHRLSKQPQEGQETCVGYLELSGSSKHLVWLKQGTGIATSATTSTMVALTDLFKPENQARLPCEGLSPQDRVRIAKQLAMAVLQFQATPWLSKPWTSKEVLMLEICDDPVATPDAADNNLFLTASIRKPVGNSTRPGQSSGRSLVRNQLLLNLGIMMLELAFQKPLIELRHARDIDRNDDLNTDYFTADRVRHQASARLGPRYAEATRKCIQCDFGSDSDLNEIKLQESFYQNVVCELEALEKVFREFKLNS